MASTIAHRYNLRPRPLAKTKKIDETVNHALVVVEPPGYERLVTQICPKYLTKDEANEIREEFNRVWVENKQLLWSGTNYHVTKIWAAQQGLQTLTDVMGPLMWEGSERCRKATCSRNWSLYMRGASALFAWRISQGRVTTVLTPPPPHRFHPSGMTNYQDVEEPILKGVLGVSVGKIRMVHPEVPGAESFVYKAWPADHCATFVAKFGEFPNRDWRIVSHKRGIERPSSYINPIQPHAQEAKLPEIIILPTTSGLKTGVRSRYLQPLSNGFDVSGLTSPAYHHATAPRST
ncbi:hypothetical protein CcaCcLH18_04686 [Colletotrichum camelliae]|nr:hypothetical protein CcaCcLH18_04686 [Colletotrichum camelliae]